VWHQGCPACWGQLKIQTHHSPSPGSVHPLASEALKSQHYGVKSSSHRHKHQSTTQYQHTQCRPNVGRFQVKEGGHCLCCCPRRARIRRTCRINCVVRARRACKFSLLLDPLALATHDTRTVHAGTSSPTKTAASTGSASVAKDPMEDRTWEAAALAAAFAACQTP
jgi:hypothetical protein